MRNAEFCIVAVGYSRPEAMKRLLDSLCIAEYEGQIVDLLISIDKGKKQREVIKVAEACEWKYGKKKIRIFDERQGLKNHIIQCGDVSNEYDAVIVLEDDITVSKAFFCYARQCVKKYGNDNRIAGISLYKHCINVGNCSFFEPEFIGYDCFLMQFAQSWGQCWTGKMWRSFKEWYEKNEERCFDEDNRELLERIPNNILNWGEHSWLKFYMAYIVQKQLFFVYPYFALSTNHSEAGQHSKTTSSDYQVSMNRSMLEYRLPEFEEAVKYDVFFERMDLLINGYEEKKVILDLYGNKKKFDCGEILITTSPKYYKLIESFKLKYRPHELNCLDREPGNDIYIYDLNEKNSKKLKANKYLRTRYDVRATSWRNLLGLGLFEGTKAFIKKFRK